MSSTKVNFLSPKNKKQPENGIDEDVSRILPGGEYEAEGDDVPYEKPDRFSGFLYFISKNKKSLCAAGYKH